LKKINKKFKIERALIEGIAKHSRNDYLGALSHIPRKMRTLYAHSYQSYLWNTLASLRVKSLGC
jgi:tRNA pseudouridine13 synthase